MDLDEQVDAVRRFNRLYTRRIGALGAGHLGTGFSLTEARVLWELAHRDGPTASELARDLGLDAGYLSRILRRFAKLGLVRAERSRDDGRRSHLRLTTKGRRGFATLDRRASEEIAGLLSALGDGERGRLVGAMRTAGALLGDAAAERAPSFILRGPRPGDHGWVVHRHGVLYAREYGWGVAFEGLVARVIADYVAAHDPKRERCWIAERAGEIVGSVYLVRHPEEKRTAKLRLLYVEPSARGLGIGKRLVRECTTFARRAGYAKITLWTNQELSAARGIYAAEGYTLVKSEPHRLFGRASVGENWELEL